MKGLLFKWAIEFKPQDCWVGVYWRKKKDRDIPNQCMWHVCHIWVCLIPAVPLHLMFIRRKDL